VIRTLGQLLRRLLAWRHGWLAAIAFAYLYVFPYYPHSANELPRVLLVRAIVDDHTFAIDGQMQRWQELHLADTSPSNGHIYSNKAPGSSLLAVPFYAAVRWTLGEPSLDTSLWLCRVVAGVIPALLFLWLLSGFLARLESAPGVSQLVLVAYAFGSMAMTFSILFFSHQLSAVCIGSAWILAIDVMEKRRGLRMMLAVGALAGTAPLVDYQAAFAGVPVAVYVLSRVWHWPGRDIVRVLGFAAAGAVVPIAILLAYHWACFGSPLRTGYDASTTFAQYHQQGFLGLTRPHTDALWGSLFAPDNGLFTLAPWLLLAIPGALWLWQRGERALTATCVAVAIVFVLFVSSLTFWRGGWSIGPRYITVMLPFLLPLIAVAIASLRVRPLVLGAACGLIVAAVVIYSTAAATSPYWPDSMRHPLYEVTFRFVRDGVFVPNLLSACGVSGLAGIVPFVAVVVGTTGWAIVRAAGWRGLAIAVVVGAVLIAALWLVPHGGADADAKYTRTLVPAATQSP
jgi:hypothetical protein